MRNFTVTLMLLVLFLSITFAIFQPTPTVKQVQPVKKEKSHIEKLLTEPALKKEIIEETATFVEKTEEPKRIEPKVTEQIVQEEVKEANPEKLEEEKIVEEQTKRAQDNYQMIDELMKKYNNDPNAEISTEDFNKYVNQMLQQQQ